MIRTCKRLMSTPSLILRTAQMNFSVPLRYAEIMSLASASSWLTTTGKCPVTRLVVAATCRKCLVSSSSKPGRQMIKQPADG